jgi:hypothetical protein
MTDMLVKRMTAAGILAVALAACSPTVKIEAPDRPIEINLNIKIEQEVRIKVERDLEQVFAEDPALFGVPAPEKAKGEKK